MSEYPAWYWKKLGRNMIPILVIVVSFWLDALLEPGRDEVFLTSTQIVLMSGSLFLFLAWNIGMIVDCIRYRKAPVFALLNFLLWLAPYALLYAWTVFN